MNPTKCSFEVRNVWEKVCFIRECVYQILVGWLVG